MPYLTLRLPVSAVFRGHHFPLFSHLVCGLLPTEHTAVFSGGLRTFFAVFLCVLTVQIVVFEGGPPFGHAAIGHGDGLRGNLHGYRRRRGDGFRLVGKKTGAVLLEKKPTQRFGFFVPAKRRTGSCPKKAIFSKRRELFRRK